MSKKSTPIPGLSFSIKRALGISQVKQKIARETGIPTSKTGLERKIGSVIIKTLFGKKQRKIVKNTKKYLEIITKSAIFVNI